MADWRPSRSRRPPQIIINSYNEGNIPRSTREEVSPSTAESPASSRRLLPQFSPRDQYMPAPIANPGNNIPEVSQSSERVLTPTTARGTRLPLGYTPEVPSPLSSRRSSLDSTGSGDRLDAPVTSPFDDLRTPLSDNGHINTQTAAQKYNIMPSPDLILFPEDVEEDDYLHNPDPNEKDRRCDIWSRRGWINVGGLVFITLGVLVLFIAYPVMYVCHYLVRRCSSLTRKQNLGSKVH
jgi:hypothetical protein